MLVTNIFPIDINVLRDYFWAIEIVQFFLFQVIIYRNILLFIQYIAILATNWSECYAEKLLIFSRKIHTKIK